MKRLIFCLFITSLATLGFGQKVLTQNADIVYLKSGGFIKGKILQQSSFGVNLRLLEGGEIELPANSIKKIAKENKSSAYYANGKRTKVDGNYFSWRFSTAWGSEDLGGDLFKGFHAQFSYGKYLNPKLSIGAGTGFDFQVGPSWRTYSFVPVFGEVKYKPVQWRMNPYFKAALGVNIPAEVTGEWNGRFAKYSAGALVQPSVGFEFATRGKSIWFIEAGYKFQNTKATYSRWWWGGEGNTEFTDRIIFRRIELSFGQLF